MHSDIVETWFDRNI